MIEFQKNLLRIIKNLVKEVEKDSKKKESKEISEGKTMYDLPKNRLLHPPKINNSGPNATVTMQCGETTYLKSRRQWPAYRAAVNLIKYFGCNEELLYEIFHFLPGVAALVEKNGKFLLGIRGNLAGTHAGMVSIPAGLMEPGENIIAALQRELYEETGFHGDFSKVAMGNNPDAPNITFVCLVLNPKGKMRETYEMKGKKFIWVSKKKLKPFILKGDSAEIAKEFIANGIETPKKLSLAPDIREGILSLKVF